MIPINHSIVKRILDKQKNKPRCYYPECNHAPEVVCKLPINNEDNADAELPFCKYHNLIVMNGRFSLKRVEVKESPTAWKMEDGKSYDFIVEGPLIEVEIAEQVIAAREMIINIRKEEKN